MILPLWAAIMDQVLWPGRGRVMAGIWDCRYGRGMTGGWGTMTYFGLEVDGCSAPCINCTHNHAHTHTHTHARHKKHMHIRTIPSIYTYLTLPKSKANQAFKSRDCLSKPCAPRLMTLGARVYLRCVFSVRTGCVMLSVVWQWPEPCRANALQLEITPLTVTELHPPIQSGPLMNAKQRPWLSEMTGSPARSLFLPPPSRRPSLLSACLSAWMSALPFIHLSVWFESLRPASLTACLSFLSWGLSICLAVCQAVCRIAFLFASLSVCLPTFLSVCWSVCLYVCLYLPTCLGLLSSFFLFQFSSGLCCRCFPLCGAWRQNCLSSRSHFQNGTTQQSKEWYIFHRPGRLFWYVKMGLIC